MVQANTSTPPPETGEEVCWRFIAGLAEKRAHDAHLSGKNQETVHTCLCKRTYPPPEVIRLLCHELFPRPNGDQSISLDDALRFWTQDMVTGAPNVTIAKILEKGAGYEGTVNRAKDLLARGNTRVEMFVKNPHGIKSSPEGKVLIYGYSIAMIAPQ
jgi:hypothetical protein